MKRLICFICMFAILMQLVLLPTASAATFPGNSREKAVSDLVYDLNIISEADTDLSQKLTYDKLARIGYMVFMAGEADEKTDFSAKASELGIVPEGARGNVSLDEAVNVLIRAIGRRASNSINEEILFGSNIGIDIRKGVSVNDSSSITLGEACKLAENALYTKNILFNGIEFYESKQTVLEEVFGLKFVDGVIFPGKMADMEEDVVLIDGESYKTEKNYTNIVGLKVRAYADKDDNIVSVDDGYFKNEICMISANDIKELSHSSITYLNAKGNKVTKQFAAEITEVYNGKISEFSASDFDISNGFITLIKTPGSAAYNVALIQQHDILVAGGTGNGIVYDYNGMGMSVDLRKDDVEVTITMNGEPISESVIKKHDVLLVSYSKDKELLAIEVVRNSVSGTVVAMNEDIIEIGRRTYVKTAYFKQYAKKVNLGEEVELILDGAGLAVGFAQKESEAKKYGYFMGMYRKSFGKKAEMKLLTEEGEVLVFNLAEKVKLNGTPVKNQDDAIPAAFKTLVECSTEGVKSKRTVNDFVYQLIIYSLNSDGEINYIDTAIEEADKEKDEQLTLDAYINANKRFKAEPLQFVDSFGLSSDTKVFYVPASDNEFDASGNLDEDKRNEAEDEDYTIESPGFIGNDEDDAVVHAYCVSKGGVADAIVLYNQDIAAGAEFSDLNASMFLVTKVLRGKNADDEECYILKGYLKGTEVKYYILEEEFGKVMSETLVEPEAGDLLQVKVDSDNNVLSYAIRYSGSKNKCYTTAGNNVWSLYGGYGGYVYDQDENGIVTVSDLDTLADKRIAMKNKISQIYIYDFEEDTVTKGTVNSAVSYMDSEYNASRVFLRGRYGVIQEMYIFVNGEDAL